ncbi:28 kDa heat- and acid-stable phosphoprotein isoform X1 [Vigna unguiculata]|uniref:28 kDa heat- and acid-stable phosphoprotein isoform X1 n=1 Tax=Vigna unguiculata TaxID=3917 RepID=UPI001015F372|nr:28 kDa heat- and acid-stable phosphoprotein isoform X1 [Vigna unguiculata]
MGRGKYKSKPTGRRQFSTPEDLLAGTSNRPRTFKQKEAEHVEEESEEASGDESGEESEEESSKKKGTQGIIEIENPNLVKPKSVKARDVDVSSIFRFQSSYRHLFRSWKDNAIFLWIQVGKTTELSRREREELEKQRAHERYMRLQEQGKTEQAKKDLERLALIRQQRAEAAKKREEEKAAKEQKKAEARK